MTDSPSHSQPREDSLANSSDDASTDMDGLVSRLQVIEDQPLDARAPAYVQLYDELRAALEGADASA